MKRNTIKLTESQLTHLIKKVIKEELSKKQQEIDDVWDEFDRDGIENEMNTNYTAELASSNHPQATPFAKDKLEMWGELDGPQDLRSNGSYDVIHFSPDELERDHDWQTLVYGF